LKEHILKALKLVCMAAQKTTVLIKLKMILDPTGWEVGETNGGQKYRLIPLIVRSK